MLLVMEAHDAPASRKKELMMRALPMISAFVIGASVMGAAAFHQFAKAEDMVTFTIVSPAGHGPIIIDIGEPGQSLGDMRLINNTFAGDDGVSGTASGMLLTVDLPDEADTQLDSMGQIVYEFGGGDMIVVAADSEFLPGGDALILDGAQLRAVIGGTGKFIGARGQVTTTFNEDGTWSHTFQLLD